ncbi:MAG TPA: FAD-dependent oxidoreductase [Thermoplasmata archaeon]|nr:FAD-dependent oxidoreductase [Thermoplasmata archaeon]
MIGILGGGLSGLVLASRVRDAEVLEAEERPGGLCRSLTADGFTFDPHGSHILFSRNPEAMAFYEDLLRGNVCRRRRNTKVFYRGRYVKYPFENGLAELPVEDNLACLLGYVQAYVGRAMDATPKPTNFREWMYYRFGKGITEAYLLPYNEKIWKTPAAEMGIEWVEGRVPDPPLEDILKSSLGIPTEGYTHQLNFLYPREGGVESLVRGLLPKVPRVRTGFRVTSIRRTGKGWAVSDGHEVREYDRLVATIPIPELVAALDAAPAEVRAAGRALVHRSLVTVMVGLSRPELNDFSWVYFPTPEDGKFNRISFPSNFSDRVAPAGTSSAMAEITCDAGDTVWSSPDEALIEHVVERADHLGVFRRSEVTLSRVARTRYAYVVFDLAHRRNLDVVEAYARKAGLHLLGRFGQFEYINTDQVILRALKLAGELEAAA